jgi:hypothetical protein
MSALKTSGEPVRGRGLAVVAVLFGVTEVVVLVAVEALADPRVVEVAVLGAAAVVVAAAVVGAAVDARFAYTTERSITWYCPRNGRQRFASQSSCW